MVNIKFCCEENHSRYLEIIEVEEKTISIYIENDDDENDETCTYVELTINDVEILISELQKIIDKKKQHVIHKAK